MILALPAFECRNPRDEDGWGEMAWATPQFSRSQVDAAGRALISVESSASEHDEALEIINNWRSSHSFSLNTFQMTLRSRGQKIDPDCLVAQRIKRLSSISLKLRRFSSLRLSQMQDIGGCRAVVRTVTEVRELVERYRKGGLSHTLARVDDYLARPQPSGYRGVHLIYKYFSESKSTAYNDLKIELQIRSQFQHAWATAVETVGTLDPLRKSPEDPLRKSPDEWARRGAPCVADHRG
jgi:ppGpp synthetase/RelA/SpoT-type nucleotidyltranferase